MAQKAIQGCESARREFSIRMACVPKFLAVLNGRMGSPLADSDVEELSQETLLAIWRRLDSYAGRAALTSWVFRFCHLTLLSHLRSLGRKRSVQEPDDFLEGLTSRDEPNHEGLYRALEGISSAERELISLKHFDNLGFDAIAQRLSTPTSTVKSRYYRAMERLRGILESRGEVSS